jgi:chemotaxis protein CheC
MADQNFPVISSENASLFEQIGNNAAQDAALALAKLTGISVKVKTLKVSIIHIEEVTRAIDIPSDRTTTVIMKVIGDCTGNAALLFSHKDALHLSSLLQGGTTPHTILSEMDLSAIKEVGNIITGAILSGISNALGISINESIPDIATDMVDATMESVITIFSKTSKGAVAFELDFSMESSEITGYFLLLLDRDSMVFLVEKIHEERVR